MESPQTRIEERMMDEELSDLDMAVLIWREYVTRHPGCRELMAIEKIMEYMKENKEDFEG
jgi:anion-transporting  ArsA/GET3 family ATPase